MDIKVLKHIEDLKLKLEELKGKRLEIYKQKIIPLINQASMEVLEEAEKYFIENELEIEWIGNNQVSGTYNDLRIEFVKSEKDDKIAVIKNDELKHEIKLVTYPKKKDYTHIYSGNISESESLDNEIADTENEIKRISSATIEYVVNQNRKTSASDVVQYVFGGE